MENLEKILDFYNNIEPLKKTIRYSEANHIPRESAADHSWRLVLMVYMTAEELNLDIDIYHAVKMAVIHDLPEVITGDYDARSIGKNISAKEKERLEKKAIRALCQYLPDRMAVDTHKLWKEYEGGITQESRYVRAMDKIEAITHLIYTGCKSYDDPEFITKYADEAVRKYPALTDMLVSVKKRLKIEFIKGNIPWKEEYDSI